MRRVSAKEASHSCWMTRENKALPVTGQGSSFFNSAHDVFTAITKMEHCKIDWQTVTTSFILVSSSKIAIKRQSLMNSSQGVSLNYVSGPWQV